MPFQVSDTFWRILDAIKPLIKRCCIVVPCIAITLFLMQLWTIWSNAVDIPFGDEWDAFVYPGRLTAEFPLEWIFSRHGDHMIVLSRLQAWFFYHLDGWNVANVQTFNFVLYGLIPLSIFFFMRKQTPDMPKWVAASFILFLLTAISWENHVISMNSQNHYSGLFFILTVYFLFTEKQILIPAIVAGGFCVLTVLASSQGPAMAVVLVVLYAIFKLVRITQQQIPWRAEIGHLSVFAMMSVAGIFIWISNYGLLARKIDAGNSLIFPHSLIFWKFFLNLLSSSFGVQIDALTKNPALAQSALVGLAYLSLILVPLTIYIWRNWRSMDSRSWSVIAALLGTLAALASITIGRGYWWTIGADGKSPRYTEVGIILLPFLALQFWVLLKNRQRLRKYVLIVLWIILLIPLVDHWRFEKIYSGVRSARMKGLQCVQRYYDLRNITESETNIQIYPKDGNGVCQTVFFNCSPDGKCFSLALYLENAKKMKFSFVENALSLARTKR